MYALVIHHASEAKARTVPLPAVPTLKRAYEWAENYARYTAMQLKALGSKPEVWSKQTRETFTITILCEGEEIVRFEPARTYPYPGEMIRTSKDVWSDIKINYRA